MANIFKKLATNIGTSVEMSFDVPDSEIQVATLAIERFEDVIKAVRTAVIQLDTVYNPFKDADEIPKQDIIDRRGAFFIYSNKITENFNNMKKKALLALKELNNFSIDNQVQDLISAFNDSVETLEDAVNKLLETLDEYESDTFRDDVVAYVEDIQKKADELEDIINDRVIDFIDVNILAKSWVTDSNNGLDIEIIDKVPLITELVQEQQQAQQFPENLKENQKMNPSDSQRVYYPDKYTLKNFGE